jgi:hypothetical protein
MAQTCQRSVRFRDSGRDYIYLRTYRNGYYEIPENLLFDIGADPHEQQDLAVTRPDLVERADGLLNTWREEMLAGHGHEDPLATVLSEPPEEDADKYRERLRQTGRGNWADALFSRESEKVGLESRRKFLCFHGIYGGTEMIISDQHRYSAMGHAGDPNIETPAMDRLAGEGPFC